ncbi:KIR-like protein [Plasmodium knowlesi strain H]|uniref:KIR-like protein n=3 Tax=Plasmodium knowlesi TaxID=5850 RepID=A0A5E7X9P8_PLAKH|nr:KIR-like protein [Plasmodium knowlesi strain H]OTN67731.1 KIR-like protein [Plasmodium knowlesi]CAA9990595.1 KIR-like protein [Plasmodium knowlesi strain H]SBO19874.1 KIR-like protein [Plasmodium knowlesi strain H]SBO22278.1 KIR-like protein [Plasmodium knowlesi strain H]VVS80069.1 KIR-like protein [Plasmodium knowlesi strain H]
MSEVDECWNGWSVKSRYKELEDAGTNGGSCHGCYASRKSELQAAMQPYKLFESVVQKMMNAWCYVNKKTGNDRSKYCDLFYYWLGNLILNTPNNDISVLKVAMETIYNKLQQWIKINECTEWPKVKKEEFDNLKRQYDFKEDYKSLDTKIETSSEPCLKEYKKYLEGVSATHISTQSTCQRWDKKNDPYCTTWNGMWNTQGSLQGEKLNELSSKVTSKLQGSVTGETTPQERTELSNSAEGDTSAEVREDSNSSQMGEESAASGTVVRGTEGQGESPFRPSPDLEDGYSDHGNTVSSLNGTTSPENNNTTTTIPTTTIISSVIPLVGLPTIAFLLYKYTSIFSPKNNSTNRGRRFDQPDLNTFMDSSTENSTLQSTLYSTYDSTRSSSYNSTYDSTNFSGGNITDSATEHSGEYSTTVSGPESTYEYRDGNSTIYNRQPRKVRTNKNTQRRKNIGYHRM